MTRVSAIRLAGLLLLGSGPNLFAQGGPSLANFGADAAVEAALRLETMGAEGDLARAGAACETLIEGYETLRAGLGRLLAPSAG